MDIIIQGAKDFFGNYMLMSAMLGWLSAQIIKIFTGLYQNSKISLKKLLFSTGGMPSSHSASVVALATSAAISCGFGSGYFAISALLAIIVMIDASGVRYETGKQAVFLNKIAKDIFSGKPEEMDIGFKELIGHTPMQVFMGALLGLGVGIALQFVFM